MRDSGSLHYVPAKEDFPLDFRALRGWYSNLLLETSSGDYASEDMALLRDRRNYYGKYLSPASRDFFLNHFAWNMARALAFFFEDGPRKLRYLDIGCGCGNQLLLMALSGAEAVGCDIRRDVCELIGRRRALYERAAGRRLALKAVCADVFETDWDAWGRFDAVNFLFSLSDLKVPEKALALAARLLKPGGRLVLQETNPSNYYNRLIRRRGAPAPRKAAGVLERCGLRTRSLRGGYALPPPLWRLLPARALAPIDHALSGSLFLSPSYQLMAEKP